MKSSLLPVKPGSSSTVPRGDGPVGRGVEDGERAARGSEVRARAQEGGVKVGRSHGTRLAARGRKPLGSLGPR